MSQETINPYPEIGAQHKAGLDSVAATLSGTTPTTSSLIDAVFDYVAKIYFPAPPTADITNELKSVIANSINGYVNLLIFSPESLYNRKQARFLDLMLYAISNIPVDAIKDFILDIEDNITKSDLSIEEQTPLLLATEVGKSDFDYWVGIITTPGDWASYLVGGVPGKAINTANLPFWVSASIAGTLVNANNSAKYGLINSDSTPSIRTDIVSAISGSIAVAAGKVIFKLQPRIQPSKFFNSGLTLTLNRETIADLSGDGGGDPQARVGGRPRIIIEQTVDYHCETGNDICWYVGSRNTCFCP